MEPTAQPTLAGQDARVHTRTRARSTPTRPPISGSAPTLRPRMPPAARRPGLDDAQHAAMTLHNTTLCATHNCSAMHTHAHIMRDTRDT